ncbi:MAG: chromosomal replication initiator protein DnaA, partial [Clostridia bacterium]|nr:chromosomal replication initiator protein DnaA [Clostridia bacterium]
YEFKEKYRKCDVLLIDDIHFLAGKEGTQEEFFHTFNELQNRDAQIVLTSDRPPRELSNLEERLVSRFGQGLTVDIMAPDFETRIAILKSKLAKEGMSVPDKVIEYIANTITTNIRDLEGCVQRLKFYSKLNPEKTVDVEFTKEAFKGLYDGDKPRLISSKQIKTEVCEYFSVSIDDLEGKKRTASIVLPRQIAQYLIRSLTDMSYPNIAEEFKADYTTVIHNCNKIEKGMHSDIQLRKQIEDLSSIINR